MFGSDGAAYRPCKKIIVFADTPCKNAGMDWNDLRHVLTVARAGTLAAAARRLNVNQTTVARRLKAAERALATRLFERRDGVLYPTAAGEAAIVRAARVEREVEALERDGERGDAAVDGTVRLTAVPILANRLLIPALPTLHAAHPHLRLELVAEPRNLSLTRREADIALRLARPESGTALTRRIGRLDYAIYAPRRRGGEGLPWITYEEGLRHLPQARWVAAAGGAEGPLLVNDAEAMLQAMHAGLGKALFPCFAAEGDPRLRRLPGPKVALSRPVWLLVHRELRAQARITTVIDWLERLMPSCRAA
jgi:DNA-binding transcriptional LysR family regulator